MSINPPSKPFDSYKWQWATVTCTEGLNFPPVYLGILRAIKQHEGEPPSSSAFLDTLQQVQNRTHTNVHLARSAERNIIRNSGQYWKALDLMTDDRGRMHLTRFGHLVANGNITAAEFAATVVKTLQLPNRRIESNIKLWIENTLIIKPLELIVSIMSELRKSKGQDDGYLTPYELVKITIPLAGEKAPLAKHVEALLAFRSGNLSLLEWPDCAPGANDKRMAREFLLFLSHYGICRSWPGRTQEEEKYELFGFEEKDVELLGRIESYPDNTVRALSYIKASKLPGQIERKKVQVEIFERPNQSIFRKNVMSAYESRCLVTNIGLPAVLEAAHIIPISSEGQDSIENSLCLRSDIHLLYDTGHLRIEPSGVMHLSDTASSAGNYGSLFLPERLRIPSFVSRKAMEWRWEYA